MAKRLSPKARAKRARERQQQLFPGPPCRQLHDMTEDEIVAIEREYGVPVIRPTHR